MSLKAAELKFLLKLLGCEGYRGKISGLSPSSATKTSERDRICESLAAQGLVEYDSEVARFAIAPPGKTLLKLDTTSLPVTPDELLMLKACQSGATTPGSVSKVSADDRQRIIRSLTDRGLLKISKVTFKEVWLTAQGKQFLRDQYEPSGNYAAATATMMGHYVRFLRVSLAQPPHLASARLAEPASLVSSTESQPKPDAQEVLQQIAQLDKQFDTDNYLPIFYLREKLQPPLTRAELDDLLYGLQREDRIEMSSLHDQGGYSDRQLADGIRQGSGGHLLFFISLL